MPGSIAPLIDAFNRRLFNAPGPMMPSGSHRSAFPAENMAISVDLLIDGSWTSISSRVYSRDLIVLTRGKSDESNVADPSTATLTLNNRNGDFSPRNPMSPYYGKIGRNTPLRISVDERSRFYGEVSAWPQKWDTTGTDVWVPIEVAGILRRLGQGASPLKSFLYTRLSNDSNVIAYWPCEDGDGSTSIASGLANGLPMTVDGTADYAANSEFDCSSPIPNMTLSRWTGYIPAYTITSSTPLIQIRFLLSIPAAGIGSNTTICTIYPSSGAVIDKFKVEYTTANNGSIRFAIYESGVAVAATTPIDNVNGNPTRVSARITGGDIDFTFIALSAINELGVYETLSASQLDTYGKIGRIVFNDINTLDDVAIGHISVRNNVSTDTDLLDELRALSGETSASRILRLCQENDVPINIIGTASDSQTMGPQLPATLLSLLTECAEADEGNLYEPRDALGLTYRTRTSQYNRPITTQLDYNAHQLTSLEPVDDDRFVRNDITVTRTGGSSLRTALQSGALSVNDPPNGIGRYDEQVTININSDDYLADQAGWRLHLGTVDEARYPVINLDLTNQSITNNPDLLSSILNLDIGDCLMVMNPPAWLPPESIEQSVRGSTEELNTFERRIALNCVPCSPYRVGIYSDDGSRYSSDGSSLSVEVTSSGTSLSVTTSSGPLWTTTDVPFDIMVGGERMTVTAIAGASSPQTFTVTRSVNGIVKAQTAGTDIELFEPVYYAF